MRRNSIVFKLFWITFSIFIVFLLILMAFQKIFYEDLYLKKKINTTKENIEIFSTEYSNNNWNSKEATKKLNIFAEKNNTFMIIMDEKGNIKYRDKYGKYTMTISSDLGKKYIINLENLMYLDAFKEFHPVVGDKIYVEGIIGNNTINEIEPFKVKKEGTEYFDQDILKKYKSIFPRKKNEKYNSELSVVEIKGKIQRIDNSFKDKGFDYYKRDILWNKAYKYWLYNSELSKYRNYEETKHNIYKEKNSEIENILFIKHIKKDGIEESIFAITSLQPINEAAEVMNDYFIYLVLLALVFIVILSFIYSKIIAKPLIEMDSVAKKMADLDFSICSKVGSNDELGSLSYSLNTLSKNLNESITELKNANEKLQDDIERERKQEQIRKEFTANVSHELKTPLGIMKGFAEGIRDGIYQEKKEYYLDVIIDEIGKMDSMIKEMLDLGKLESKGYNLSKSEFNIEEMIININNKFKHHLQEKNIALELNIYKNLVCADKRKIEQVILNLFSNAVRYTEKGGRINISTEDRGSEVCVYVKNTGAHIKEKDMKKIWDRFYRVDKSRSRSLGGTGLGLPIVKNILELHDSKYGVKNTENGVEFYFTLNKVDN